MTERMVQQTQGNTIDGINNYIIDMSHLRNGMYVMQILENNLLKKVTHVYKAE